MSLHCQQTIRRSRIISVQWWIDHDATKIASCVIVLQPQQTSGDLKFDLGGPLALVTMSLPMMDNQFSRVKLVTTMHTPLFQKSCKAR
jgi:hypothetical protein